MTPSAAEREPVNEADAWMRFLRSRGLPNDLHVPEVAVAHAAWVASGKYARSTLPAPSRVVETAASRAYCYRCRIEHPTVVRCLKCDARSIWRCAGQPIQPCYRCGKEPATIHAADAAHSAAAGGNNLEPSHAAVPPQQKQGVASGTDSSGDGSSTPARGETKACEKVTRVTLVDHRDPWSPETRGVKFEAWNVRAEIAYQDDGRTLKVFVTSPAREEERHHAE